MKLNNITIENFRCFKNYKVKFAKGATVFIGKNGSGKTSLLNAIRYGLSVFFSNDKSMGEDLLCAGNPDLKVISTLSTDFYRGKDDDMPSVDLSIQINALFNNKNLDWEFYKKSTSGASLIPSKYQVAYRAFMQEYRENGMLPLFVFYSDSFPHVDTRISDFANKAMQEQSYIIRNFAYYKWNSEVSCTLIWQKRFINSLLKNSTLKEEENSLTAKEIKYIKEKMIAFSKPVNETDNEEYSFEIEDFFPLLDTDNNPNLYIRLKNGRDILFNSLPAGYKRLYSIAFDLSYRLYILQMKNEKEPSGIAIIDEIDLHLHPSLEQEVLIRFLKTFPKIQFIVSTHSPMVLSNLKMEDEKNSILRMVEGEETPHPLPDLLGVDYNSVVIDFMDTPHTNEDISKIRDSILRLRRRGNNAMEDTKKQELKKMVSQERYEQIMNEITEAYDDNLLL